MSGSATSADCCVAVPSCYPLRTTQSPCSLPEYEEWAYAGGADVCGEVVTCSTSMWVGDLEHGWCHGCGKVFFFPSSYFNFMPLGIESRYRTGIFLVHGQSKKSQAISTVIIIIIVSRLIGRSRFYQRVLYIASGST